MTNFPAFFGSCMDNIRFFGHWKSKRGEFADAVSFCSTSIIELCRFKVYSGFKSIRRKFGRGREETFSERKDKKSRNRCGYFGLLFPVGTFGGMHWNEDSLRESKWIGSQ